MLRNQLSPFSSSPSITLLKSSFKSSISSIPTLIRIISSYTPESSFSSCVRCAAIVLDGCIASVFVSPIFDTSHGILSSFRIRKACSLLPVLNVYENIVYPIEIDGGKTDTRFVKEIIHTLGLEQKLKNMPNNLSGGQQQRVAIARALATKPAIILADVN